MTTHRCFEPVDDHGRDLMRGHVIEMALVAVEAGDDQRCTCPTCPGARVVGHLRRAPSGADSSYLVAVASAALRLLGEAHRDGVAALVESVTNTVRDVEARPTCTCCHREVAPLTDGRCGHCRDRCADVDADGGCSLRKPPPRPGESS